MANYYIDSTQSGTGASAVDAASNIPVTILANTDYKVLSGDALSLAAGKSVNNKDAVTVAKVGAGADTILNVDSGSVAWTIDGTSANNTFDGLNFVATSTSASINYTSTGSGFSVANCAFDRTAAAASGSAISFGASVDINDVSITDTTFNYGFRGISQLLAVPSTTVTGITITGCTFNNLHGNPIRLTVEAAAYDTSVYDDVTITGNTLDTCAKNIFVRCGSQVDLMLPLVRGSNWDISSNTIQNGANYVSPPASGTGSLSISGSIASTVSNNYLYNNYTTGGLIGGSSNSGLIIESNYCEHAVASADIDAVGIFDDQGNTLTVCRYNTIVDCLGYGSGTNPDNYGGGIALWKVTDCRHYSNVVKDSLKGFSYGDVSETGNKIYNNTLIDNAAAGLYRYGSAALAGAVLFKNNLIIGSAAVEAGGTASSTLTTNLSYATTTLAGLVVDSAGLPTGLAPGSPCIGTGTDLDQYTVSKNGTPYFSPPSVGAHEVPRPFDMFSVGWMG